LCSKPGIEVVLQDIFLEQQRMGLLEQSPAHPGSVGGQELDELLAQACALAQKHGVSAGDVIAAARVLELRRATAAYQAHGDAHEEHMAGLGSVLQRIATALEEPPARLRRA
jgi:hypothetical protein